MKPIVFDHKNQDVLEACQLADHNKWMITNLVEITKKIMLQQDYSLSHAMEEVIRRNQEHFKMDTSMPIMDDELLPVYLSFKLGEVLNSTKDLGAVNGVLAAFLKFLETMEKDMRKG